LAFGQNLKRFHAPPAGAGDKLIPLGDVNMDLPHGARIAPAGAPPPPARLSPRHLHREAAARRDDVVPPPGDPLPPGDPRRPPRPARGSRPVVGTLQVSGTAISSTGLTKRFGALAAVDRVDLHVPQGSVYGFLGPNGSGKTTTIRILLGLVFPTAGEHRLLGRPTDEALRQVGALVEGPAFHPYLSGRANLLRLDAADRTADTGTAAERIGTALDRVGLAAAAGKRYRNYSLGMRQR